MGLLIPNLFEDVGPDRTPRPLDLHDCNVKAFVRDQLDGSAFLAERRSVDLDCDFAAPLPIVQVDDGRLEQVLSNLIGNTLNFTVPGVIISVSTRHVGPTPRRR